MAKPITFKRLFTGEKVMKIKYQYKGSNNIWEKVGTPKEIKSWKNTLKPFVHFKRFRK